jgi:hypothetical protein
MNLFKAWLWLPIRRPAGFSSTYFRQTITNGMIGEKDTEGSAMTICSLPLQNDDYSDIAPLMMIVCGSIGLIMGAGLCGGRRIISPI